ncbi:MAG: hypothetical protein A2173_02935 [Planctomycetes bacterium RBG_13_44_8b]|nr:MAG: hypothetical protein A2173_02935 [Planctomycetes bacterium RBG_13_44_8b]
MEIAESDIGIKQKAKELINIIKTRFVTADGFLARTYPAGERTLFDNFDDIMPFFLFFDETDFLLEQVRIIRKKKGSMLSLCADDGVLVTRNIDEWFGGLYSLWMSTGDEDTHDLLKESVEFVLEHLVKDGFLSAAFYTKSGTTASYYESWSSGLLEVFCEMRKEFPYAFQESQKILKNWVESEYFRKHSLFPYRVYLPSVLATVQERFLSGFFPVRRHSKPVSIRQDGKKNPVKQTVKWLVFLATNGLYSQLMKSNSTCAFTLLEFYRATQDKFWSDSLLKWASSAIDSFCDCGKVYMEFVPKTCHKRDAGITPAFILADILCDIVYFVDDCKPLCKDKLLSVVKEILDYGWRSRLNNGMIPYIDGGDFAHIDSQVDFAVSLRRYSELSGESSYKDKSIDLTQGVIKQHYSPGGYFTYSGKIANNTIDPKYNALLLKGFANLITIEKPLYPGYYSLFKDR